MEVKPEIVQQRLSSLAGVLPKQRLDCTDVGSS